MGLTREKRIEQAVFAAVDELNEGMLEEQRLNKSGSTLLYGDNGCLDSLGLVNLIVAVEEQIADTFEINLTLADEKAMSQRHSPFRSLDTLCTYIEARLAESIA